MGDGMTKKHHLLLYSLLGVCLVIAVGFAIAAQRGKRQYARALEDAYRGTLLSSMTQMEHTVRGTDDRRVAHYFHVRSFLQSADR